MASDKTSRLLKSIKKSIPHVVTPIASDMILPNHSGNVKTPTRGGDLVNKSYADSLAGGGAPTAVVAAVVLTDETLVQGDGGSRGIKTSTVTAAHVTANNAKTGITSAQASAITANTAKTGITSAQASAITANTAKTGITSAQASAITANTAKVTYDDASDVASNTSARHTQNTDTALGSGCTASDHGTASTDQVINVCYGTSATPPTASTTTEGTLYIQYTA